MTTEYNSKKHALEMGLFYIGFGDKKLREEKLAMLLDSTPEKEHLGWPQDKEVELYKITNPNGKEVGLGIGEFRDDFDLWIIDLETGFCNRA